MDADAYRLPIVVDGSSVRLPHTPVAVEVDFDELLPGVQVRPETIEVRHGDRAVAHRLSDGFRYGSSGVVYFVIDKPGQLQYDLVIEAGEPDRLATPDCLLPIGIGDPLHYNAGEPLPLPMRWGPQIADLEGDGTLHLTMGTHWTTYCGWPPNVIFHCMGQEHGGCLEFGSVAAVRARQQGGASPEIISEDFYVRHHIVDWDGDGRPDLATVNSGAREVKLYRNTGEPGPLFEYVATYPTTDTSGYLGLQLADLSGDGRLDLLIGGDEHLPRHEKEPVTSFIQWYRNTADAGELPRFEAPRRLALADGGDLSFEGPGWSFLLVDLDGDGQPDLLYSRPGHREPLVWYRNLGPHAADDEPPVFRLEGAPAGVDPKPNASLRLGCASGPGLTGPIVDDAVYQLRLDRDGRSPALHSPRPIVATNPEVNGGGQAWPCPCDWDGDGDVDLVAGHGAGHVQLLENVGTRARPAFRPPVHLHADAEEIRIWRDDVLGGHHWHGMAGYTKPVYADWDGDGVPDLVVANETNRIFWFRNEGTARSPVFGARRQIEVEGFEDSPEKRERSRLLSLGDTPYPSQEDEAFGWRTKAAVLDWGGDGLADLVAVDGEGHYARFERYREGPDSKLRLRKAMRFCYDDGGPVTHDSIPRETTGTDSITVCDWQGRGVWDLLVGTCYAVFYLENRGTNDTPCFARPVRLKLWGEEIRHSRHGLDGGPVDWDGDGQLSWLAGSESGMFLLFRRAALDADGPPAVAVG